MYLVSTQSLKSAERHGGGKAYLARLSAGLRGSIERHFVKPTKATNGAKGLASTAMPGDVFECRRWLWNGARQQYEGGTVWFAVGQGGEIYPLTRDEAFAAVGAVALPAGGRPEVPDYRRAQRVAPSDISCVEAPADSDIVGETLLHEDRLSIGSGHSS